MKRTIEDGDIVIRKATNGWVVIKRNIWPEEEAEETILVYEDDDTEWGQQEAFARLLRENFFELVQSKKRGGITLQIAEKGYGEE
jgi:hypothetical protein